MTGFTTKQYTDRRRPPWLWPVVALAAVIVVAVVVGFSLSGGGGPPAAQQGTPASTSAGSAPPPAPAGPAGGGVGGGSRQPSDPNYLTAAPAGLRFQDVGGLTLPFSPVDGPLRVTGPIAAGYSHTPQGAVIAAMQLAQRIGFGPDYRQVVSEQVTGDPSVKATIINYRASHPQDNPAQLAAELAPPVGFRVETYTADRATVVLLNRPGGNAGGFVGGRGAVVWSDGDWKLPIDSPTTSSPVTDTTGYTLF